MTIELATGVDHIAQTFKLTRSQERAALMPYFTLGYPDSEKSMDIIQAIAESGADLIELGVPFSDPLADGPTIQHSTQAALLHGTTVQRCLEMSAELRRRGLRQPFLMMGYINPILSYGITRFVVEAAANGIDGLIVPDLPPEESFELEEACRRETLALVYLLAPTSTAERIQLVAERSEGFIYLVSVTGVTGARGALADDLEQFIQRVRDVTDKPLAVGFGISTPEQVAQIGLLADGVIVGSALINVVENSDEPVYKAADFIVRLRQGLHRG